MSETVIKFNAHYQYVWLKNIGTGDCYVSDKPHIQAEADGVSFLPVGGIVMITMLDKDIYVLGDTIVECHAQEYSSCPFGEVGGSGGGSEAVLGPKSVTQNGDYYAVDDELDGYSSVSVNVEANVDSKSITQNGTYTASSENLDGYSSVSVDVPNTYVAADEGKVVSNSALVAQTSTTKTQNGTYDTTLNDEVVIDVPNSYSVSDEGKVVSNSALVSQTSTTKTQNGTYDTTLNDEVVIDVPNSYAVSDEGKVVSSGVLVAQTSITKTANGTYDTTLNDEVVVNVTPEIEPMTRSEWNALTTAQKQAKGLVGIKDANTGYARGVIVNGADYPVINYLPNSNPEKLFCEAYVNNFSSSANSWGNGARPVQYYDTDHKPTLDTTENAIYVNSYTDNFCMPYVDLKYPTYPFTAYVVMKAENPSNDSRLLFCLNDRSGRQGIFLRGEEIYVGIWDDDTGTGVYSTDYFVGVITLSEVSPTQNGAAGYVYDSANDTIVRITKTPSTTGRYITICSPDLDNSGYLRNQVNGWVRYFAVIDGAETQATIEANIRNLYNTFIAGA